jgi:hypothetical protein
VPAAVGVLLLTGCTSFAETVAAERSPAGSGGPGVAAETAPRPGCPAERAEPDPDRPVVDLDFRLEDDLRTVTGRERVVFTPDRPVRELVFRLAPNAPESAAAGNRLVVDDVRGRDVVSGDYESAGAVEPGGLYVVELDGELQAGESTEVELDFTISLGTGAFDRLGADTGVSWWASGAPLLAWEPGVGWARDPFVDISGETTSSPVAETAVTISVPAELTVLMTGDQAEPSAENGGRRIWTSTEPLARDVSVAFGRFATATTSVSDVRITAGVLPGESDMDAEELAADTAEAISLLEPYFGEFPYETLTVPLLPPYGGGIEYPSSILMAGASFDVLVHEVAHMYFYGMVGNSQFRDPWLDEAFATYAEYLTDPPPADLVEGTLGAEGAVGASIAEFPDDDLYFRTVYGKGGAALLTARERAGAEAFDRALRCYLALNAWATATPEELVAALAALPEALDVLVFAEALDESDLPR